jgi:hypothetical protein
MFEYKKQVKKGRYSVTMRRAESVFVPGPPVP